jgi:phospholipid-binding lipoprotein MlaA
MLITQNKIGIKNIMRHFIFLLRLPLLFGLAFLFAGCATNGVKRDPLEPINRVVYSFNEVADKAVIKPVATVYQDIMPSPVRTGVTNFFSNLGDVIVIMNDLLQFKLDQAASDTTRLITNTTFGVLGIFDVASQWGLEKHDEDFGQTLGYWGVGSGPYLVLPLLGSSTLRDTAGLFVVDNHVDPVLNIEPVSDRNATIVLKTIDTRANLLGISKVLDEAALDPYSFLRDGYLQRRRSLVYDGKAPIDGLEEDDEM